MQLMLMMDAARTARRKATKKKMAQIFGSPDTVIYIGTGPMSV